MYMMRIFFKPVCYIAVLAVLHINLAYAQEKFEWPRTFSGQPDFVFTQEEVLRDNQEKAENGEEVRTDIKPWSEVLTGLDIHPFRQPQSIIENQEGERTQATSEDTLLEDNLPTLNVPEITLEINQTEQEFDVIKFEEKLRNIIETSALRAPVLKEEINPQSVLGKLRIQTISTSPFKYVQINNQRLDVGQTLYIPIQLMRSYTPVERAVRAATPKNIQDPQKIEDINKIIDKVLKEHQKLRQTNTKKFMVTHDVAVTVKDIKPRIVMVDILGQEQEIKFNYAF